MSYTEIKNQRIIEAKAMCEFADYLDSIPEKIETYYNAMFLLALQGKSSEIELSKIKDKIKTSHCDLSLVMHDHLRRILNSNRPCIDALISTENDLDYSMKESEGLIYEKIGFEELTNTYSDITSYFKSNVLAPIKSLPCKISSVEENMGNLIQKYETKEKEFRYQAIKAATLSKNKIKNSD